MSIFDRLVIHSECVEHLKTMADSSVDAVVTDPPYGLSSEPDLAEVMRHWLAGDDYKHRGGGFMGKSWDSFVPGPVTWREVLRVLKPGGHLLCFAGSRTVDLMGASIRLAGFEIRDQIQYLYGCLDDQTEILIDGKWKRYNDVEVGQSACCYDADADEFSWQPLERVVRFRYSDTAYRLVGDRTDQLVTRDHRCLVEQDGAWVFSAAEDLARQRQACIPVLEDVSELLADLSVPDERTSRSQQDVFIGLCECGDRLGEFGQAIPACKSVVDMPGLQDTVSSSSVETMRRSRTSVLSSVSRHPRCRDAETDCQVGKVRMDCGIGGFVPQEDERGSESSLEGWRDVFSEARELQTDQVCSLSSGVIGDGSQGWICDGASSSGGLGDGARVAANGGGSPYGSRSPEQRAYQFGPICVESGSQTVRASRYTEPDLVRVEPVSYDGLMWRITVPTGAFVARRLGKVFVTGNSGFPKSLDVSKAIDKAAGAEREVVGRNANYRDAAANAEHHERWNSAVLSADLTAPATPEAKQWDGWGTALKPAHEPIIVARKPLAKKNIASNVIAFGTGAINIDACRIATSDKLAWRNDPEAQAAHAERVRANVVKAETLGRFPANVILAHHPECQPIGAALVKGDNRDTGGGSRSGGFAQPGAENGDGEPNARVYGDSEREVFDCHPDCPVRLLDEQTSKLKKGGDLTGDEPTDEGFSGVVYGNGKSREGWQAYGDSGGASRFFYTSKVSKKERSYGLDKPHTHPTAKPIQLMCYFVRLVTPPGGLILDPFVGSGSTGIAAVQEGFRFVGIEQDAEYVDVARQRIEFAAAEMAEKEEVTA